MANRKWAPGKRETNRGDKEIVQMNRQASEWASKQAIERKSKNSSSKVHDTSEKPRRRTLCFVFCHHFCVFVLYAVCTHNKHIRTYNTINTQNSYGKPKPKETRKRNIDKRKCKMEFTNQNMYYYLLFLILSLLTELWELRKIFRCG